ncbi:hypothetical protein [Saccharopolyspora sp. 6V]|uniref:hypothetical protein n=1 Tax=Saccharopolyspora sp. 6V TaxID=2877239 RepID=UPI001CD4346A|nr:hypothetical protein [Saccharopolyspora sp. 6V]MCA1192864.1 hypothetical protein [Saccharopolyspora sp. 6V]
MSTGLEAVQQQFTAARGVSTDGDWAQFAVARLVLDGVPRQVADEAVRELLPTVADSGEAPAELFGTPADWAAKYQRERWENGENVRPAPDVTTRRDLVIVSLIGAGLISSIQFLLTLLDKRGTEVYTPMYVLFPLLLSAAPLAVLQTFHRARVERSFHSAVGLAAGTVVALALIIATLFLTFGDSPAFEAGGLWHLVLGGAWWAAAWIVGKVWPQPDARPAGEPGSAVGDDQAVWCDELAATLRRRDDMTDARVAQIIAESRDHIAQSGRSAREEFGSPESYADRFERAERVRSRRLAWFWAVLAALATGLVLTHGIAGDWQWSGRLLTAGVLLLLSGSTAAFWLQRLLRQA